MTLRIFSTNLLSVIAGDTISQATANYEIVNYEERSKDENFF